MPIYTRPVKCNVQIINIRKAPATFFGLAIVKFQKKTSLYHSAHNKIFHTTYCFLKHNNKLRRVTNEALRWLRIITDTGKILKVETTIKEIYQQLLNSINADVVKIKQ